MLSKLYSSSATVIYLKRSSLYGAITSYKISVSKYRSLLTSWDEAFSTCVFFLLCTGTGVAERKDWWLSWDDNRSNSELLRLKYEPSPDVFVFLMRLTSPVTGWFWKTSWSSGPRSEDAEAETSVAFICTEMIVVLLLNNGLY
jgi:hypothetical protein